MRTSFFALFLVVSLLILPALSTSHAAGSNGYSENLDVNVAGSSALWYLNFHGVNASAQAIVQAESQSGLTSYVLTALKTSTAVSDFQVFWGDGYRLVNLPFLPDQGVFLVVQSDSAGTSAKVASHFDDYLSAAFVPVSSAGGRTTFFSPLDFNNVAAPAFFKLIPTGVKGFTSIFTESQFVSLQGPMLVLSAVRTSGSFNRTLSLGAGATSVIQSDGRLLFSNLFRPSNSSLVTSAVASSSTIYVHSLDGYIDSNDPARITNNEANMSGSYSISAPLGRKVSPNITISEDPPVVSATRLLDRGSAQQGDNISVTLTLKNPTTSGTAQNVKVNDSWWEAYPGIFQLVRGNTTFDVTSLAPGKDYTNLYILKVASAAKVDILIPSLVSEFSYTVGTRVFASHTVFNQAELRLNDVGPAIVVSASSDEQSGSPLGVAVSFSLRVTNLGNGPALSVKAMNQTLQYLSQGGQTQTFNFTLSYNGLVDTNMTRMFKVQWQTPDGRNESLMSNSVTVILSHSGMVVPYVVASAKATIPAIAPGVHSLNVTYNFKNQGKANATGVTGLLTLPAGLSCSAQNLTGVSCAGGRLSVNYSAIATQSTQSATVPLSLANPDNYVLLPMNVTTSYMGLQLHSWSSPVAIPLGLRINKTFTPSEFFPGMSPTVTVSLANVGSMNVYNAYVTSPADTFDSLPSAFGNQKSLSVVTPQERYSFNYTVSVHAGGSGNITGSPVAVSLVFAGLSQSLSFAVGVAQILPSPTLSVMSYPKTPVEGNTFSTEITISNPARVSVSSVHVVIPLPNGLSVVNSPSSVSLSGHSLVLDLGSIAASSSYGLNVSLRASSALALDLSKSSVTFNYQGVGVTGTVPNTTLTVKEDVTTRYIEPIILAVFLLLLFTVVIRRRVPTASSPSAPASQR